MKGFSSLDNSNHKGKTNTWLTPKYIINDLGPFDLDPCAAPVPRPWDTAKEMWTEKGLDRDWFGRVWLNPPYGRHIGLWLDKLYDHGKGIALVFARTDTRWFHKNWNRCDDFYFFKGRIKFCRADGSISTNAGHGSMLFYFGEKRTYKERGENV